MQRASAIINYPGRLDQVILPVRRVMVKVAFIAELVSVAPALNHDQVAANDLL